MADLLRRTAVLGTFLFPDGALAQDSRASGPIVRGEIGAALDAHLSALEGFGFSGVALAAKGGDVLLSKGYGLADREKGIPFGPETVVNLGSITKPFTAAAVLRLEADGKLSVLDPISRFLPGVPGDKQGITLHHLLTHSSGLRSDFAGDYDPVGRDEYLRRALGSTLLFAPGSGYEYSNAGFSLLAAIVEIVSGKTYETFLAERVLEPAGMRQTGYLLPRYDPADLAQGYRGEEKWGTVLERPMASDGPHWALRGNGGLQTTAGDMWRWHRALLGDAILPAAERERMFTPHVAENPEGSSHYGYGWAIFKTPRGTKLVGHNGGNGIFAADFLRFLDEEAVLFVATNADAKAWGATRPLSGILFGEKVEPPPRVAPLAPSVLASWAGSYRLPAGGRVEVSVDGKGLRLASGDPDGMEALFGAVAASPPRAREILARTEGMLRKASEGDFRPMHAAFGAPRPLPEFESRHGETWKRWREELGALKGVRAVIGPAAGEGVRTFTRLEFEKGERFLEHRWDGEVAFANAVLDGPPSRTVLPESDSAFASLDFRRGEAWRVRFATGPDGAARCALPGLSERNGVREAR